MNALERWIEDHHWSETHVMNILQEMGVISDEAVEAKDVCNGDAQAAVDLLDDGVIDCD